MDELDLTLEQLIEIAKAGFASDIDFSGAYMTKRLVYQLYIDNCGISPILSIHIYKGFAQLTYKQHLKFNDYAAIKVLEKYFTTT